MVIDVFSKYGWIRPLKDKKGETVAGALKSIFSEGRRPKFLWVDKGREYYNQHVKKLLESEGIHMYSTENEQKSSVVERWNRTMKEKMWKKFTEQNSSVWINILPQLLTDYNNTKHRTIGMTPIEASKQKNHSLVYFKLNPISEFTGSPRFKVGDKVRISKCKRPVFDKGYTPNWTEEIFVINEIQLTDPITYKLSDMAGEAISGSFYRPELIRAAQEIFRIDKVLRKSKGRALVKWKGYPEKFNSWIPLEDLERL